MTDEGLLACLGLGASDLEHNRAGQISPGQLMTLRAEAERLRRLFLVVSVLAGLAGGFFLGLPSLLDGDAAFLLPMLCLVQVGLISGVFGWRMLRSSVMQRVPEPDEAVTYADGLLQVEVYGRWRNSLLLVDNFAFSVERARAECLLAYAGQPVRIYLSVESLRLLAIELR